MNEKPATTTTRTAAAATTAERHKAEKNVSYRVALVWSVQKNHNEKNSYFCSTLKRTAQSTPQSQCGGFFAVPLFTVALCSFCCCSCFCCFSSSRQVYLHFYCSNCIPYFFYIFIALFFSCTHSISLKAVSPSLGNYLILQSMLQLFSSAIVSHSIL